MYNFCCMCVFTQFLENIFLTLSDFKVRWFRDTVQLLKFKFRVTELSVVSILLLNYFSLSSLRRYEISRGSHPTQMCFMFYWTVLMNASHHDVCQQHAITLALCVETYYRLQALYICFKWLKRKIIIIRLTILLYYYFRWGFSFWINTTFNLFFLDWNRSTPHKRTLLL